MWSHLSNKPLVIPLDKIQIIFWRENIEQEEDEWINKKTPQNYDHQNKTDGGFTRHHVVCLTSKERFIKITTNFPTSGAASSALGVGVPPHCNSNTVVHHQWRIKRRASRLPSCPDDHSSRRWIGSVTIIISSSKANCEVRPDISFIGFQRLLFLVSSWVADKDVGDYYLLDRFS